jgi:hypothetical protein
MTLVWIAPWLIANNVCDTKQVARDATTGAALDLNRRATLGRSSDGAFDDFGAV